MNEVQCLAVAVLLFKRVLEHVKYHGHLTADEKTQILMTIHLLVQQFLSCGILNKFGQVGELLGQFQVPRIQNGHLKNESANADDE
jgi:hypothetical protein